MTMSENRSNVRLFETICHFNCRNFLPIFKSNSVDGKCLLRSTWLEPSSVRSLMLPHSVIVVTVVIAVIVAVVEVGHKGVSACVYVCWPGLMCCAIIVCVLRSPH